MTVFFCIYPITLKGIVYKNKNSVTHPHVITNPYDFQHTKNTYFFKNVSTDLANGI